MRSWIDDSAATADDHPRMVHFKRPATHDRRDSRTRRAVPPAVAGLALAAGILGTAAPVASADPPWSAPALVPGTGNGPAVATSKGHVAALVTADRSREPFTAAELVRLRPADGSVLSDLGVDLGSAAVAAYARNAIGLAGSSIGPSGTVDDHSRVRAGTASATGGAPELRTLPGTRSQNVAALVGNGRGDVALATRGLRSRLIFVRRAGTSALRLVLTIPVGSTARGVSVALSPAGQLLVVWEDRHEVFARHRGSRSWGRVHALGPGIQSDLQAAMDATGRMLVAWKSQRVDEGEGSGPAVVSFMTAAAGRAFGPRRTIETVGAAGAGHYVGSPGVRLQVTGRDHALLAWTGFDGAEYVARAATLDAGHVGARQQVSPAGVDAVLGDIAAAPDGEALALWRSNVPGADPAPGLEPHLLGDIEAAGAATFNGPEAIGGDARSVLDQPTAVLDPLSGRALALFTDFATDQVLVSVRPPAGS